VESGSCSPSRGTGGCCRGPTARGERNARRRRPKVRGNGHYDDGRLDGDEVYANAAQRRAHPGVDDDSLIQDTIESIEETCAVGCPFNGHRSLWVFQKVVVPRTGALSAPPTKGQPFSSALSMEQTISRMRIARSSTSAIEMHLSPATARPLVEHAVENVDDAAGYYALHFCLRILIPLSNSSEGETGGSVQRWCLIQYAQISAP